MTEKHFPHVKGGFTIYLGGDDVRITDVRFVLGFVGEDPTKLVDTLMRERGGDFALVPVFAHGLAPRASLCTKQSLEAALQTVQLDPGGAVEKQWRAMCAQLGVALPEKRRAA